MADTAQAIAWLVATCEETKNELAKIQSIDDDHKQKLLAQMEERINAVLESKLLEYSKTHPAFVALMDRHRGPQPPSLDS